eukprot:scaffold73641_cov23-Prasinocladus_malaysianus.AAC.1
MELISREVCEAARARGDTSMQPFKSNMGKQVAPPPTLDFESSEFATWAPPNAVPPKQLVEGTASDDGISSACMSSESGSLALKKGGAKSKAATTPATAGSDASPGVFGKLGRALKSLMWGVIGGSTRRVQHRDDEEDDKPRENDQLLFLTLYKSANKKTSSACTL